MNDIHARLIQAIDAAIALADQLVIDFEDNGGDVEGANEVLSALRGAEVSVREVES